MNKIKLALGMFLLLSIGVFAQSAGVWVTVSGMDGSVPVPIKVYTDGTLATGADPGGTIQACNENCVVIAGLDGTTPVAVKVGADGTIATGADPGGTIQACSKCTVIAGLDGTTPVALKVGADGTVAVGTDPGGTITACDTSTSCTLAAGIDGTNRVAIEVGSDGTLIVGADPGGTVASCSQCISLDGNAGTVLKVGANGIVGANHSGGTGGTIISSLAFSPSASSIVATWTTSASADSNLSCGGKSGLDNGVAPSGTSHEAIVTGLAYSTTFSCVVTSNSANSTAQNVTTTALDTRTPFGVAVFTGTPTQASQHGDDNMSFESNDGYNYIVQDDGYGFDTSANAGANMQLDKITNTANYAGSTINLLTNYGGYSTNNGSDGPGGMALSNKQTGLFGENGSLFIFQNRSGIPGGSNLFEEYSGNIMQSRDHGSTWNTFQNLTSYVTGGTPPSPLGSYQFANDNIASIMPIRYAADDGTMGYQTAGNRIDGADGWVYAMYQSAALQNGTNNYLLRVGRADLYYNNGSTFQYWIGPSSPSTADFISDANWSSSPASATAIFTKTNTTSNGEITFVPGFNSYIFLNWYYAGGTSPNLADSFWEAYTAPTPAGPWTFLSSKENSSLGYYMPKILHSSVASNSSALDVKTSILYTGNYANFSTYIETYSSLDLAAPAASYNFSSTENPLSDGGNFSTITGYGNLQAVAGGYVEASTAATNSNEVYTAGTWSNNQCASVKIATWTGAGVISIGPGVRMSTSGTGYILSLTPSSTSNLYKLTGSGGYSSIAWAIPGNPTAGDTWSLCFVGTSYYVYQNGLLRVSGTDSTYSSGHPGLYEYGATLSNMQGSLWQAFDLP